jgi:peroxiredoxin
VLLPLAAAALAALAGCDSKAVSAGDRAPAFTLPAAYGTSVSLSDLLENRAAAVLVFYRGFF